ncbi:MAG: GNAT family N-acetyltransferase [Candidatus Paceibacterota bacterium]
MEIEKIDASMLNKGKVIDKIALVYKEAFGNDPWNEGYKCPVCGNNFPLSYAAINCPLCKVPLIEYWPTKKIISDFYQQIAKDESICLIARNEDKIIGFAWGYKMDADGSIDEYLDAPKLHNLINGPLFYIDEVGVSPSCQNNGIGKKLVGAILQERKYGKVMLRTINESRMFDIFTALGGKTILAISRKRVIMLLDSAASMMAPL